MKAKVTPGACGLSSEISVKKVDRKKFRVTIMSECEMVEKLNDRIPELEWMDAFKKILQNPVYIESSKCLKHCSCPVPSAILKALEIEAGLALPKEVKIVFEEDETET